MVVAASDDDSASAASKAAALARVQAIAKQINEKKAGESAEQVVVNPYAGVNLMMPTAAAASADSLRMPPSKLASSSARLFN
ncbi:MAG: hypothetical protein MHMPM18_004839 [Marteilia pararefringens]